LARNTMFRREFPRLHSPLAAELKLRVPNKFNRSLLYQAATCLLGQGQPIIQNFSAGNAIKAILR
jgi:hypothetical protein